MVLMENEMQTAAIGDYIRHNSGVNGKVTGLSPDGTIADVYNLGVGKTETWILSLCSPDNDDGPKPMTINDTHQVAAIPIGTPFVHEAGWSGIILGNRFTDLKRHFILAVNPTTNVLTEYSREAIKPDSGYPSSGNLRPVYVINPPEPAVHAEVKPLTFGKIFWAIVLANLFSGFVGAIFYAIATAK